MARPYNIICTQIVYAAAILHRKLTKSAWSRMIDDKNNTIDRTDDTDAVMLFSYFA